MRGRILLLIGVAALLVAGAAIGGPGSARPDLVVTSLGKPPASLDTGKSFSLKTTVKNGGSVRAGASTVLFLLSANKRSDPADVRLTGRRKLGRLNAGKSSRFTQTLRIPTTTPARAYYVLACADGLKGVRERSESNNCRVASRRITVKDTTAPAPPSLTSTSPSSPGNDATPNVKGTAEAGSIVTLYKEAACAGPVAGSGTTAGFAGAGLTSTAVLSGQTTTFSATATDPSGNVSLCSTTTVTYFLDDDAPSAPTITGTNPASPSSVGAPVVEGTAEPGADIDVFVGADCTGTPAATATADGTGDWSVATPVTQNASNSLRARQTDVAGNPSSCSGSFTYVEDSTPPSTPSIVSTLPGSPSQEDQPTVSVDGTAGLVVRVYNTACTGIPLGSDTADGGGDAVVALTNKLSEGTNNLRADTVDEAGNRSSCSDVFPYVLDTMAPPAPVLSATVPVSPSTDNTPGIRGTASGGGAVSVALYASTTCAGSPVATGTPTQLAAAAGLAPPEQLNGTTVSYTATAVDAADNTSACSNVLSYTERRETTATPEIEPNKIQRSRRRQRHHVLRGSPGLRHVRSDAGMSSSTAPRLRSWSVSSSSTVAPSSAPWTTDQRHGFGGRSRRPPTRPTSASARAACGRRSCLRTPTSTPSSRARTRRATCSRLAGSRSSETRASRTTCLRPPIRSRQATTSPSRARSATPTRYSFTLDAPASVRIEVTSQIGAAQSCEAGTVAASLQVQNAAGSLVFATDSSGGINSCAIVDGIGPAPTDGGLTNLPAGTYTILAAGTAGAAYSLVLTKR